MSTWTAVLIGFEYFILIYFSVLVLLYALSAILGLRSVVVYSRELSPLALKDLVDHDYYKPVSILVPAYNEQETIVANLKSLLALRYPEFEVIVAVDGATDETLDRMIEAFDLEEQPQIYRRSILTEPVTRMFRSPRHRHLIVADKQNGGRADAINAALNLAQYPLVCVVDADSILSPEALARASRLFVQDDSVIAVGGSLRPLNGTIVEDGAVVGLGAPRTWVERMQVLEYARAFFIARAAWSRLGSLMSISGAFGLFRRDAAIEAGGWIRGFVADDTEMVVKLHRHFSDLGQKYRITFTPDPVCWTDVPSRFRDLRAQRCMWERGVLEVLWRHKSMLFNPRYGRVGLVGVPYMWIFETGATIVETLGYLIILITLILGILNIPFMLLFFALSILFGVLFSELGMSIQTLLLERHSRPRDRFLLFLAAFAEYFGMRQVIVFSRAFALLQMRSKRGQYWGAEVPARAAKEAPAGAPK